MKDLEYKKCSRCIVEKELSEFFKNSNICKECKKQYMLIWRKNNKLRIKNQRKKYHQEHPMSEEDRKVKKLYDKKYHLKNRDKRLVEMKNYSEKNKEYLSVYRKEYIEKNRDEINEKKRIYSSSERGKQQRKIQYQNNKQYIVERNKLYRKTSPKMKDYYNSKSVKEKEKKYRQSDIGKAVKNNYKHRRRAKEKITNITNKWLGNLKKNSEFCLLCNCKMNVIKYHPQSKHLDHIIPLNIGGTHTMDNVRYICRTCNLNRPKDGSDITKVLTESV